MQQHAMSGAYRLKIAIGTLRDPPMADSAVWTPAFTGATELTSLKDFYLHETLSQIHTNNPTVFFCSFADKVDNSGCISKLARVGA